MRSQRRARLWALTAAMMLAACTGSTGVTDAERTPTAVTATAPVPTPPPQSNLTRSPTSAPAPEGTATRLHTTTIGDGTTVTRVEAADGSTFALRLPDVFGDQMHLVAIDGEPGVLARVDAAGIRLDIEVGYCFDLGHDINALGVLADQTSGGSLHVCRPDQFVGMVVDSIADVEFSIDQLNLVPLAYGKTYVEWLTAEQLVERQCCFEYMGPMWFEDTIITSNGHLDGQVSAIDGESLAPIWSTDLLSTVDSTEEWVGDGSHLYAVTESGTVLATTGYGWLLGLSAESGELQWQIDLDQQSPIAARMFVDEQFVVVSDRSLEGDQSAPTVRRIDVRSGMQLWEASGEPVSDPQWSAPVLVDDVLVVADVPSYRENPDGTETAHLIGLDFATGRRLWTSSLRSDTEAFSPHDTVITDSERSLLFAMNVDGDLFRFDPRTGTELWSTRVGFGAMTGLAPDVITVSTRGRTVDVDIETGAVID